jgi:hypothetical protein
MMDSENRYYCVKCDSQYNKRADVCICGSKEIVALSGFNSLLEAFNNLIDLVNYYMDVPKETAHLMALWTTGTYFHEAFNTYPFLFFNAMRGSGKSRALRLISYCGNMGDGKLENDIREAGLFRMKRHKIVCLDEIEQIGSKEKATLRQLLNSAYKKGSNITRMKKVKTIGEEKFEAESFEPYFPIALANIWGMEEVLSDRSITVILEKSNNPCMTKRVEDFENNLLINSIKANLSKFSVVSVMSLRKKTYISEWNNYITYKYGNNTITPLTQTTLNNTNVIDAETLEFFEQIDSAGLDGRNFELAYPLLITAKLISENTFRESLVILKEIFSQKKEEEFSTSKDVSLYDFIAQLPMHYRFDYKSLKGLTSEFRSFTGDEIGEEQWVNEKWLGRALKRLGLILDSRRLSSGREVTVNIDKAKEKLKIFKSSKSAIVGGGS